MNGIKTKYVILVTSTLIGLIPGSAFAQTVPGPKQAATRAKVAVAPPRESAEHKAAVQAHDYIAADCVERLKVAEARVEAARDDRDRLEIEIRYQKAMEKTCTEGLAAAAQAVEHVDGCVAVYRRTIDKKVSDLTTRETGEISECKSMRLYPPKK